MNNHRNKKNNKLRYSEYYGMQEAYDNLYQRSVENQNFKSLMKIIISDDNILLAYRNIKRNSGSLTAGIDGKTIKDIEKLTTERYLDIVKKRFKFYKPRKVKRTEIPKPNGKTRPLGIPSIWDRVAQQCILQVLEPICEAKFNPHSHGFRPNRSAEHAIADCAKKMNIIKMGYCVDIDIQGFFDEVWHSKLIRQMWTMGIRDKELLAIIRKMLKAPVVLPNGTIQFPKKGTPQGGILSPLLANINLNEFDWWISEQWETRYMSEIKTQYNANGTEHMGNHHRKMRSHTKLKEFYIVRYADDFKLFCHNRKTAELLYHASIQWLEQRLHLPVSIEKSKITNLRKESSEFLGFNLKLERKGKNRYIMHSHVSDKAINRMRIELKEQIKEIKKSPNSMNTIRAIGNYNSKVIGMHGYYRIATHVNKDFKKVHYSVLLTMRNRLSIDGLTKMGKYTGKDKGILNYVQSKNIRYLAGRPIIPVSFVQHRNPMYLKVKINKYTPEGRELIHRNQSAVSEIALRWIRSHPVVSDRATVEFNDNRISLFIAQLGKCSVTGEELNVLDMHCHHKIPYHLSKDDKYSNLIIVKPEVHILIHATKEDTIQRYMTLLNLNDEQVKRLNKLRLLVRNTSLHY
ncbi:group II intron reverse transcriptase/maturase [Enterococcus pseudoavium]|jgi:group II intron reverse transcriptase/maturase|uniref:Group II intron reverse transcriptase/maturase n=2 Tax=Enterococcus TaxID=1350 RepID=A0AAE4I471_9ENTE|nr:MULTISPECIES: group II intron reverse transcriptase/maturase [Enterococcus]MCU7779578.1 group II intron reverse transcriptase/maturase [Enterococcus faecalis]MDT2643372.1 group II intron reverse transcriptase/maturase [Enterococcus dongliensis]MDT2738208.1 group II intron reverse transcriptase/maturase [Enterococcus pseudoavium]MDT2991068.1 group II intron reverse transcriptase/maturase [Enterococcus casseliflavus]UDM48197.1 group II intron reverse transcriptase/maturase [Enterococcus faeca